MHHGIARRWLVAAEALRGAQRATMSEFSHPFFWAAFNVTGVPH